MMSTPNKAIAEQGNVNPSTLPAERAGLPSFARPV
jgi:hypothetical protein